MWKAKKFPCRDFPSPRFSRLKTWNFTSGWVKNRVKREIGDSCVVTCHREHIDNQNEREVRDCGDATRQQPGNFSLFLRQSSLSVNNKMSSYQATVELVYKSGERRFWLIGDSEGDCRVWSWKCDSRGIKCIRLRTRKSLLGWAIGRRQLDRRIRQRSIGGWTEEPGVTK